MNKEPLGSLVDYDVDGFVSESILFKYLQPYCPVTVKIPDVSMMVMAKFRFLEEFEKKNKNFKLYSRLRINSGI
ncbi:MAG: hypothetical protein CM15mP111_3020 [Hyphomicrobiales bacterium]|nr:MAG: hypothetical protein CM15mP111_3020 [Hyphomicrobiales bacterium]